MEPIPAAVATFGLFTTVLAIAALWAMFPETMKTIVIGIAILGFSLILIAAVYLMFRGTLID